MMRKLLPNLSGIFDLTYHLDLVSKILQREQMKHIKLTGMDHKNFLHSTLIISHVFFRMSVHPYQYTNTDND